MSRTRSEKQHFTLCKAQGRLFGAQCNIINNGSIKEDSLGKANAMVD